MTVLLLLCLIVTTKNIGCKLASFSYMRGESHLQTTVVKQSLFRIRFLIRLVTLFKLKSDNHLRDTVQIFFDLHLYLLCSTLIPFQIIHLLKPVFVLIVIIIQKFQNLKRETSNSIKISENLLLHNEYT